MRKLYISENCDRNINEKNSVNARGIIYDKLQTVSLNSTKGRLHIMIIRNNHVGVSDTQMRESLFSLLSLLRNIA